jgi:hypothetical protein
VNEQIKYATPACLNFMAFYLRVHRMTLPCLVLVSLHWAVHPMSFDLSAFVVPCTAQSGLDLMEAWWGKARKRN